MYISTLFWSIYFFQFVPSKFNLSRPAFFKKKIEHLEFASKKPGNPTQKRNVTYFDKYECHALNVLIFIELV